MAAPLDVTDADFQDEILNSDKPVLVDFWADWCGPCRMIAPHVKAIAAEHSDVLKVAKMDVERRIRMWDNWRIVRATEVSEKGYYYNVHVKTDNPGGYIAALDRVYAEMQERGYDLTMQIFMGDTGETAGMVMVSLGSSDRAEVGRMMDARSEGWFQQALAGLDGTREIVHGFSLVCETYSMAEM